jgi:hypothetical protein
VKQTGDAGGFAKQTRLQMWYAAQRTGETRKASLAKGPRGRGARNRSLVK